MSEPLNVLLVVIDSARADHLSCYGCTRKTTPFLDQVAQEGVRFAHMITAAPWTLPAHASLFTGLFPSTHGATSESAGLSPRPPTLAQILGQAGYRSAGFCTSPWVGRSSGLDRGFDHFDTQTPARWRARLYARRASDRLLRRRDGGGRRTNRALMRWIASSSEPFFAFVHYNEASLPPQAPSPLDQMFAGPRGGRAVAVDMERFVAGNVDMTDEQRSALVGLYDGALRYIDGRIREVADFLDQRGLWERTLLMVTADHGEHLGEHHLLGHSLGLTDSLLRVPLLLRCPGLVPQGFVVEELAQTVDLFPTVTHMLGLGEHTAEVQGRPLIREQRATSGPAFTISERFRPDLTPLVSRFPRFDPRPYEVRSKAIRTRRDKYVWHSHEDDEYYDLRDDPGETRNRVRECPQRADELRGTLFDWLASIERADVEAPVELEEGERKPLQRRE